MLELKGEKMKKIGIILIALIMLVGCKNESNPQGANNKVALSDVQQVVEAHLQDDYVASMDIDQTQLEEVIGLNMADIEDVIAKQPMMSTHVDTFISVKAKTDKANDVEKILNEYRNFLVESSMQYPGNIAKVNASEVVRHGDYVFFIMLGGFDQRDGVSEEQQLEFAKNEVAEIKEVIGNFFK